MTAPVLTTRRLTLRPIVKADADQITRGLSNWDVVQWLSAVPFPYARQDAIYFITEVVPTTTTWAIDAGEGLIGVIGVKPDLGYWLNADFHGQHIMTEAASAVVQWYFENAEDDLISGHFVDNAASRTILTRLGFTDSNIRDELRRSMQDTVKLQTMKLTKATWTDRND